MFVLIYGRPGCPFCVYAKQLAEQLSNAAAIDGYRYIDMYAAGISKDDLQEIIGQPVRTVPQVLLDQTPIGGFTEFAQYVSDHALLSATTSS